jgi:signal transduction histidine kinase
MSMQERARMLGGKIVITSNPGKGTCIVLSAPIHNGNQSEVAKVAMAESNSL